jgi:crotonobetainyl-CoA:carnitine CoA-transferase CaiB-like acyl-CoA transferase
MPPLEGIRVIDLTRVLAGPFCTMMLGDMGADVIKIEEPAHGDESRGWAPIVGEWSSYFLGVNRNKKSVALDLKHPEHAAALRSLISQADVLVENFKPGSLRQLGFDYESMAAINPRLVYCSISGYGHTGPKAELTGYDVVIQGDAGLMAVTGAADGPPTRVGIAITDYLAGLYACQGILLAIIDRQRTDLGQHVDIALFDSLLSAMTLPVGILLATGSEPRRMGNEHPSIAPYETLQARDALVVIAVGNPRLWQQLCAALDAPELAADPRFATNADRLRHRPELKGELESRLGRWPVEELLEKLTLHDVPCGRVRTVAEALADPQVAAREMVLEIGQSDRGPRKALGNLGRLPRPPTSVRLPPPRLGEHTSEILKALCSTTPE